ncbi:repressor of the inhibitor of the protein kinase [Amphibalanus amphitrite]|uniref:Repressor of the inhibitor of the protein kinase n=1 Tax=Amphibalanus amphitrite TaxID=1232801 RepID=A0A6A4V7G3_AMPAM|nr:repressor of the inhibitor of the protein kinase [Amphibalanus amphitrite]
MVETTKRDLQVLREGFQPVFETATELSDALDVEVAMPRTCKKQTQRANAPAENTEEHYLRNIFLPVVDAVISELTRRFPDSYPGKDLLVIPSRLGDVTTVLNAAKTYEADLPSPTCLGPELTSWRARWAEVEASERPSSALEALNRCSCSIHPNI